MIPFSYPLPRVSQLDAEILDSELTSLLKEQLASIFQLHSTKPWSYAQQPELWDLLLNVVIFRLTTWKLGSSYGLTLQNLKLTDFRSGTIINHRKRALLLAVVVGGFAYKKLESYLYSTDESPSRSNTIKDWLLKNKIAIIAKVNSSFKVLNLLNFVLFLLNGRYPLLVHRVLGISLTPVVSDLLKFNGDSVNFEFQNRQLVWNVMTEFLVFIMPLLQIKKIRNTFRKLVAKDRPQQPKVFPFANLPLSQCAICHLQMAGKQDFCLVTNPYITNCGHIFCYICLATRFNAINSGDDDAKPCVRCGEKLEWFEEYEGEPDPDAIIVEYEEPETHEKDDNESDKEQEPQFSDSDAFSEGEEFGEDNIDDLDDYDDYELE